MPMDIVARESLAWLDRYPGFGAVGAEDGPPYAALVEGVKPPRKMSDEVTMREVLASRP